MDTTPILPPTSSNLLRDEERPYFLWWLDATVGDFKASLRDPDPARQAYWIGALIREANSRDVPRRRDGIDDRLPRPGLGQVRALRASPEA